jgi:hypothetical protein
VGVAALGGAGGAKFRFYSLRQTEVELARPNGRGRLFPPRLVPASQTNSSSSTAGCQPLLWAALAFASRIVTRVHAWRPPQCRVLAWIVFAIDRLPAATTGLAAADRRTGRDVLLGRPPGSRSQFEWRGDPSWMAPADGREVGATADVMKKELCKTTVPAAFGRGFMSRRSEHQIAPGSGFAQGRASWQRDFHHPAAARKGHSRFAVISVGGVTATDIRARKFFAGWKTLMF